MFEYVATLLLRKIDVENDDIGTRLGGIYLGLIKKVNGLLTVPYDMEIDGEVRSFDRSLNEICVRLIILHDQEQWSGRRRRLL